ncbi:ATP-binding protein [Pseudoxanthomonas sangjuensis]|uniref:ATP-binding protein n=1 Tax=Pseudoxanthomonas sangjuensis TaxID=1503750 RepID=UPI001390A7DD|nr:ATP-binding protein [Pseudoxanthomonas sangjuensis]KAF1708092.1 anti-sigma F factor [Pseudoxanthomonas sangjuensis]
MLIRLIVPGEHARVEDLNTSLEAVLKRHNIDPGVRGDVRLIVEELASNAIDYGGADGIDMGQHELSVHIAIDGNLLSLDFRDGGAPFDPLSAPDPDLDADILDRPIGGLGLYLIRQLAEELHYERAGDYNLLRVKLRIPTEQAA